MGTQRLYDRHSFNWDGKLPSTIQNDTQWLESIVRNAAPYSDGWTKARIVQLAYPAVDGTPAKTIQGAPVYGGFSEPEIVQILKQSTDLAKHPEFEQRLTTDYVIKTLNAWKAKRFSQTVSRNFEIYCDRQRPNVFLVTSTAPVSVGADRTLPPPAHFRPLFNVDELAQIIHSQDIQQLTLRTHGYASPAQGFYDGFLQEAKMLNRADAMPNDAAPPRTLSADHLYIGYQWPSEQPVTSPSLWTEGYQREIGFKFILALSVLAGIFGTLLYGFLALVVIPLLPLLASFPGLFQLWNWTNANTVLTTAVQWYWIIPTVFMLWLLLFWLLRIVVYQRDRDRAINYGAPDLAEFFWRLDRALDNPQNRAAFPKDRIPPLTCRLKVNLIGHSMGALVVVNVLRILSDRFGKDDQGTLLPDSQIDPANDPVDDMGKHLELDKLILASPDIPLEFLREGRNNYVRSAIRRCRRIYLLSSDRDIVLRYLSTVVNWFSEPSLQMAGMRLGNLYLKEVSCSQRRRSSQKQPAKVPMVPQYLPYIRILFQETEAVQPTSSYDLFRKFNYLDCSEMGGQGGAGGVNSVPLKLNSFNGLFIDLLNTIWFVVGGATGIGCLDVHGGYFQTQTLSFQVLKFLLTVNPFWDDDLIKTSIADMVKGSRVRFLPSQPWVMPTLKP